MADGQEPGHPSQPTPKDSGCRPRAITVLLVEPHCAAVDAIRELLEDLGFKVLAVRNAAEAQSVCREPGVLVDVLVTELRLPDGDACDLSRELRRALPELPVIFVSIYAANDPEVERALAEPDSAYLEKALDVGRLAETIQTLTSSSQPRSRSA
jgi:CheY-like chemotaxis protein